VYFSDGKDQKLIPTHIRNISDVSGAGDTVIAVAYIGVCELKKYVIGG